ncbi:MAG TPA: hypothetical protein VGI39_39090 [Polyangiaceae bacterium]|jgi:hypothetical protein
MICGECGTKAPDGAPHCLNCGGASWLHEEKPEPTPPTKLGEGHGEGTAKVPSDDPPPPDGGEGEPHAPAPQGTEPADHDEGHDPEKE